MVFYFSICGLIIMIIFMYNFFSKERFKNIETNIYKYLLIITSIDLSLDILTGIMFLTGYDYNSFLYGLICKLVFTCSVIWFLLFAFYIKSISIANTEKEKTILNKSFTIFIFLSTLYECIIT